MEGAYMKCCIADEDVEVPIIFGKYKIIKIIGTGAFSIVALVTTLSNSQLYACKICSRKSLNENNLFYRFEREVRTLQTLNHPNIVRLYDVVYEDNLIYLIMEYCQHGELFQFIIDQQRVPEFLARNIFKQLLDAIAYIHSKSVAHRDIKPENILLDAENNAKIADFGLCHPITNKLLETPCGSPFYAPPEVIANEQYDGKASDVWSLGVVLFTMVTGSLPWRQANQTQLYLQIQNADFVIPGFVTPNCRDIIQRCMSHNPSERPMPMDLIMHPWFEEQNEMAQLFGSKPRLPVPPPADFNLAPQPRQRPIIIRLKQSFSAQAGNYHPVLPQNLQSVIRKVPRQSMAIKRN